MAAAGPRACECTSAGSAHTLVIKDDLNREITGGGGDNIALGERFRDRGFTGGEIDELRVSGASCQRSSARSV